MNKLILHHVKCTECNEDFYISTNQVLETCPYCGELDGSGDLFEWFVDVTATLS